MFETVLLSHNTFAPTRGELTPSVSRFIFRPICDKVRIDFCERNAAKAALRQMFLADGWKEYEVLDASGGEKLERWGSYVLLRPDPQVIWHTKKLAPEWKKLNAHYHRSSKGGGEWEFFDLPKQWEIHYCLNAGFENDSDALLTFHLKPFSFKHTGLFPEQAANWDWFSGLIRKETKQRKRAGKEEKIRVLNLFAYTGGATIAAAKAGAHVTHVDASKGMVQWAKENARSSQVPEENTRWLVDDCKKFAEREIRRGNQYDAIIMDPPSYGRGPKGEIWKMEDGIFELLTLCEKILKKDALFFLLNSYTTGLQPAVLSYLIEAVIKPGRSGTVTADEVCLPVKASGSCLPCGASGRWVR